MRQSVPDSLCRTAYKVVGKGARCGYIYVHKSVRSTGCGVRTLGIGLISLENGCAALAILL